MAYRNLVREYLLTPSTGVRYSTLSQGRTEEPSSRQSGVLARTRSPQKVRPIILSCLTAIPGILVVFVTSRRPAADEYRERATVSGGGSLPVPWTSRGARCVERPCWLGRSCWGTGPPWPRS